MRFDKKALITLIINQPGVLADYYADGLLVATQVLTYQLYVTPNKSHRFDARNLTDPAAGGIYRWRDASATGYFSPAAVQTVTFRPQKEFLKGFLKIACQIANAAAAPTAYCQPTIDGVSVALVTHGSFQVYPLDPGVHAVEVVVGPQEQWATDRAVSSSPRITAGATTTLNVTLTAQTPLPPGAQAARVTRIVDGDTIEVTISGVSYRVRYIGINTPETNQTCGSTATAANAALVGGKDVILVKDVSETDQFGRLLRYVYVGSLFVNAELVRQGFAQAATYPPDVAHAEEFRQLEAEARAANRGCWATGVWDPGSSPTPTAPPPPPPGGAVCDCSANLYNCGDFPTHAAAQACFDYCVAQGRGDVHGLDGDDDGLACESLP